MVKLMTCLKKARCELMFFMTADNYPNGHSAQAWKAMSRTKYAKMMVYMICKGQEV